MTTRIRLSPPQRLFQACILATSILTLGLASTQGQAQALPSNFNVTEFESLANQIVKEGNIPGMGMAIVHNGKIISARGYGQTKPWGGSAVTAHTVYRLASLSKSFASTTTGILVNDGKLRWEDKVQKYAPYFSLQNPAAAAELDLNDLLSHRTGLPKNSLDRDMERGVDFDTMKRKFATIKLTCEPGTCYNYQNVAYSVVGDVLQAVSGQNYPALVRARVMQPLGMYDSSLGLWGLRASASWAPPTVFRNGAWTVVEPKPSYYEAMPAAGVNASVYDMAQYMIAHLGHRPDVLPESVLDKVHGELVSTPSERATNPWRRARLSSAGYALGWRILNYSGHKVIFHGGAVQGYRTVIAMMPDRDIGIVILWNSEKGTPSGLVPMVLDRALGLVPQRWVNINGIDLGNYDDGEAPAHQAPADKAPAAPAKGKQPATDPLGEFIKQEKIDQKH